MGDSFGSQTISKINDLFLQGQPGQQVVDAVFDGNTGIKVGRYRPLGPWNGSCFFIRLFHGSLLPAVASRGIE
jgi:hypothetical protein